MPDALHLFRVFLNYYLLELALQSLSDRSIEFFRHLPCFLKQPELTQEGSPWGWLRGSFGASVPCPAPPPTFLQLSPTKRLFDPTVPSQEQLCRDRHWDIAPEACVPPPPRLGPARELTASSPRVLPRALACVLAEMILMLPTGWHHEHVLTGKTTVALRMQVSPTTPRGSMAFCLPPPVLQPRQVGSLPLCVLGCSGH